LRNVLFISRYVVLSSALESTRRVYKLSTYLPKFQVWRTYQKTYKRWNPYWKIFCHYEKKGCFATRLETQILSCIEHLQLTVFICCECYWTSCKSYKSYKSFNLLYIRCNSLQLNYNFVITTPFQLLHNSPMITIIMSCWHHFSSIHQNLTCGTMKIFCDFFEILISIVHYDYSF
jgi:hypothetical protein